MQEGHDRTIALTVFCCCCIVDDDGEPMFSDSDEDKKVILRKSDKSLGKVIAAVLDLASFKEEDAEDIKKNC
jgi:hypothetical protein